MAAIVEVSTWRGRLVGRDATTVYIQNADYSGWVALPALPAGSPVAVTEAAGWIVAVNNSGTLYRATPVAAGGWQWASIGGSPA
jgi:hypothetical protein